MGSMMSGMMGGGMMGGSGGGGGIMSMFGGMMGGGGGGVSPTGNQLNDEVGTGPESSGGSLLGGGSGLLGLGGTGVGSALNSAFGNKSSTVTDASGSQGDVLAKVKSLVRDQLNSDDRTKAKGIQAAQNRLDLQSQIVGER